MTRSTLYADQPDGSRLGSTHSGRLSLTSLLALTLCFARPSAQQKDPVTNFCRRFGHQSAIVDEKLYLDGGLVNWNPIPTFPNNYTNTWLLYQDLSTVASSGMPQLYANLSKNGSIPSVHGGALWADDVNKRLFLFGGEYYQEPPISFNLFSYDILTDQWDSFGPPAAGSIQSVSYGAGVSVPSRGEAYYYGGWLSNASIPGWGDTPVATSGLIKYSMDTNNWANNTGPDGVRRAEGSLNFIPASDAGMLVYLGGVQDLWQNGTAIGQPMDQIFIYDVLSGKWYVQTATGTIPEMRRRFCAGVTWAADQSSYNIYLYGGAAVFPEEGAGFDDLYILTMPSFTWIKMYPTDRNGTGDYPHHSLSCNVVSGAQMLIIGGTFPLGDNCDAPDQWGTHNNDMGRQNEQQLQWELYEPNKTTYAVPFDISDVVGGGKTGGATKVAPDAGFAHSDLRVLMTRKAEIAARTPTRDVSGNKNGGPGPPLSTGAIVGIAVAGAAVLIAVAVGGWFCLRRKRQRPYHNPSTSSQPGNPYHTHSVSDTAWSPQTSHFATSSPFQPHSPYGRPHTVPPHTGPPVELAAGGTNQYPQQGYFPDTAQTTPAQQPYYPDGGQTMTVGDQPKFDAQGNMWIPQVSMVQISPTHRPSSGHRSSAGGSPLYDNIAPMPQLPPGYQYSPTSGTPRSEREPQSPQELGSEHRNPSDAGSATSPRHQTYYHP